MKKQSHAWWLAGSVALVLAGCGGGSGGGDNHNDNNGPVDPVGPVAPPVPQPNLAERIEPLDTLSKSTVAVAARAAVERGLAAAPSIAKVTLAPANSSLKQQTLDAAVDAEPGVPVQIGVQRDVSQTATVASTSQLLSWKSGPGGSRIAAIAFESPAAQGVRLGVLVQQLPAGATLRFYGAAGGEAEVVSAAELQTRAAHLRDSGADDVVARTYWSPEFGGTQTTMEIEVGSDADISEVQLAVPSLSHFAMGADELEKAVQEKASGSCNIDVMCQPDYLNQGRAVARMVYVKDNGSYLCTGTLLNDAKSSGTPYFLTANHCISSQAEASSLMTNWFYTSSSCNSGSLSPATQRLTRGASLLYSTANTDTSFLQLNEAPPSGVVFAGSYFGAGLNTGSPIVGVHHPDGDPQKLSIGSVTGYGQCADGNCKDLTDTGANFYGVNWQQGTTEGGSSGSALLFAIGEKRYVTGTLFGGRASCQTPNGKDYYGRFDLPYKAKIKQWLNP